MKLGTGLGFNAGSKNPKIATRFFMLFNGVDEYIELQDDQSSPVTVDVDQVKLFVFPISGGNTGLPTGAPVLTNGVWHELDYTHSGTISEIGKNGANYFHGYIANVDLLSGGESVVQNRLNTDLTSTQLPNLIPAPEA